MNTKDMRIDSFLRCLGNGKTIEQCEYENEVIEADLKREERERWKDYP